jgi:hypothetical protein
MLSAVAEVRTEMAARYLGQLCKHFQHRLPVELDADRGRIAFEAGVCTLAASPGLLTLRVEAADADALARVEDVVARHLLRFAFREPPEVMWV